MRSYRKKSRKYNYFSAALILLIIVLMVNKNNLENSRISKNIVKISVKAAKPLFYIERTIFYFKDNLKDYFKKKQELISANENLKKENGELKIKIERAEILEKENEILSQISRGKDSKDFLVSYVLFRPPNLKFDTIIIDKGEKDGVKKGMKVIAYPNIMIGEIEEILSHESVVRLLSYYGNSLNVLLQKNGIFAEAKGMGGENFEIILDKELNVEENEIIFLPGPYNFVIGKIAKVEKEENAPFQKIYFRFPLNLNRLKYVQIMLNPDFINMEAEQNKPDIKNIENQ